MKIIRSATIFATWTAISRILGFVRDILFAITIGANAIADVFIFAYRFPHLFRTILAEGAMTSSFIPIYQKRRNNIKTDKSKNQAQASAFANSTLILIVIASTIITLSIAIAMPHVVSTIAVGFKATIDKYNLAVSLARIAIFYLPLVATTALLCAILSAHGFFALYGAMPVILNAAMITVLLPTALIDLKPETIATMVLYTIVITGGIQVAITQRACKRINANPVTLKTSYKRQKTAKNKADQKNFLILFAAAIGGHGFVQITFLVNQFFASKMQDGTIAAIYYAERLVHLPIGIIAVAITNVMLPEISRLRAQGKNKALGETQNQAFAILIAITIPCAIGLASLNQSIIFTLFQYGEFSSSARIQTANILAILAIALPAFAMLKPMLATLFAFQKPKAVLLLAILSLVANILLVYNLIPRYNYIAIPIAITIAAWVNLSALVSLLILKRYWNINKNFIIKIAKIMLAAIIMWLVLKLENHFIHSLDLLNSNTKIHARIASLASLIIIPAIVYASVIILTKTFSFRQTQQTKNHN